MTRKQCIRRCVQSRRHLHSEFGVRLIGTADSRLGEATVSVAGEYEVEHGFVVDERTVRHFANEVGVMTVLPYLREGLATITAKVFGAPAHLPIIPRGEITIDLDDHGMDEPV